MPIAQERMIAMVQEFLTYNTHTEKFINDLKQTAAFYHKGDFTIEEAMAGIIVAITNYQPPPFKRLYIEEAHFAKKAKYNEKKKRYVQGQKLTQQGLAQEGIWLESQAEIKPFSLPQVSTLASPQASPYSREETLQMQQDIERALAPPPLPQQPPPPIGKPSDAIPDLSEYQVEPPDFKKGIF